MKKILLLLFLMCATLTGSAQYWEKYHGEADELKGTSSEDLHYANIPNVGIVIIHDELDLITFGTRKGIFDYKRYKTYYTVVDGIVGMYDENGKLIEKVNIRASVSEDSPGLAKAYFNTDFDYEGAGVVKKVVSWIRNNKGSVRFIFPKYGDVDFDVKLPTLLSQERTGTRSKPKGTVQKKGTKPSARRK